MDLMYLTGSWLNMELSISKVKFILFQKVRPQVDADLMRLWSDTKAWHTRVYGNTDAHDDAEVNIQRPLFELNTFSANKVGN